MTTTHEIGCRCLECGARRRTLLADRFFAPLASYHNKRGEKERAESARRAEAKARGS
jgi:hypothetical protein